MSDTMGNTGETIDKGMAALEPINMLDSTRDRIDLLLRVKFSLPSKQNWTPRDSHIYAKITEELASLMWPDWEIPK